MSLDLLHESEELLSPEMSERSEADSENETAAAEPISRFGLLSEELSGGAGAMYLREIAHHELLTAQEEVSLAQRLEGGMAALRELATADESLDHVIRQLKKGDAPLSSTPAVAPSSAASSRSARAVLVRNSVTCTGNRIVRD